MSDFVRREAVKDEFLTRCSFLPEIDKRIGLIILDDIPSADAVEVVHAKWEPVKYNAHCSCGKSYGTYHFLCSACNRISYAQPYRLNYCPNCGARMDGE